MSRLSAEMSRFVGTNDRDGTRARARESGTCPVPVPVPFRPLSVPIESPRAASGWAPQPGTIPHRVIEWLRSMAKVRPGYEPSTTDICLGLDVSSDGFTAYMRPAREHGLVHARMAEGAKLLLWRIGDGTRDSSLHFKSPADREDEARDEPKRVIDVDLSQVFAQPPLPPAPPPKFRAIEWEGQLLVTGMEIRDGVAIFSPEQVIALKRQTDWWMVQ